MFYMQTWWAVKLSHHTLQAGLSSSWHSIFGLLIHHRTKSQCHVQNWWGLSLTPSKGKAEISKGLRIFGQLHCDLRWQVQLLNNLHQTWLGDSGSFKATTLSKPRCMHMNQPGSIQHFAQWLKQWHCSWIIEIQLWSHQRNECDSSSSRPTLHQVQAEGLQGHLARTWLCIHNQTCHDDAQWWQS